MLVWCSLAAALRLALEPAPLLGVAEHLRRQHLQRHVPAERDLLGLVDDAHAAAADLADDPVVAELLRRGGLRAGAPGRRSASPSSDSSARAMFSIIAIAGKTSRISPASSGWRSMYSFSDGPLALAVALEELLGQLQHHARIGIRR